MTKQHINIGDSVNDKRGDPLRTAFDKVNQNFDELYNSVSAVVVAGATAPTTPGVGDLWYDTESGRTYVYYDSTWVDASPVDGAGINSTNELVNGNKTVSLASTGVTTFPTFQTGTESLVIQGSIVGSTNAGLSLLAKNEVLISADLLGTAKNWQFDIDGNLTFPQGTLLGYSDPGGFIIDGAVDKDIAIYTYSGADAHGWTFGTDGGLTFPGGTLADLGGAEFGTGFSLTTDGDQAIIGASNLISLETSGGYGQLHLTQDTETDKGRVEIFFQNGLGVLWIFDEEDSSLTFPDTTKQTTAWTGSVSSLVNSTKTVSLGSNGTLTLPSQPNLLTNVNQIFTTKIYKAAKTPTPTPAEITAAYDYWIGEQEFYNTLRNEDASSIAPATRSWAGLPPWEAYPLIMGFTGGPGLPPMPSLAPAAQSATNAYLSWKELVSNLEIVNGNQTISFENTGNLILPSTVSMNGKLSLGPTLGGIHANQSTGIISIGDYIDADTGYGLAPSTTIAIGGAANVFQISTYGPPAKTWTFARDGNLTLPSGNSVISNLNVVGDLSTGSQIQVGSGVAADTGIIISNSVTNSLGEGGPALESGSLVNVNGSSAYMALKTVNSLEGGGGPTLTGEEMVEVSSSGVRIGVRVTNDLGDGSPPVIAFSGWTFDNEELALPIGTVISETPSQHGLNRTKYSGNFVLDPTWFAANTGNIVNGDSFPEGILQNYDEVSGAFSFQYFGYFVPPTSANYTFRAHADETFVFWIGSKALSGYTYANKDMYGNYNGTYPEQQTQSFTIALTAGEFYPIRIQWANSGGIGQLDVFTWANDIGQANTADFTGRVFRENTGTAKIAVNDNRSIILSTDNATDNNWTFAPNGALTLPAGGDIVDSTGTSILDRLSVTGSSVVLAKDQYNTTRLTFTGGATIETAGYLSSTGGLALVDSSSQQYVIVKSDRVQINTGFPDQGTGAGSYNEWQFLKSGVFKLPNTGIIQTSDKQWTLDTNGRTIFPNGVVPEHSYGAAGDKEGMVVFTDPYIYYCKQDYVDNSTDIWVRVAWTGTNW